MKITGKYGRYSILIGLLVMFSNLGNAQEVYFFSEGTDNTYYDQGIVDVDNLGRSTFEYTHPPGAPQWNDKVPCSTVAYKGSTSLKFSYTSSENGSWKVSINRSDWATVYLSGLDSLSFYVYSEVGLPNSALPLIGLKAVSSGGTGDVSSKLYKLSDYNSDVPAGQWTRVIFPLSAIFSDKENVSLDFTAVKAVVFNQSETDGSSRLILIDEIAAFKSLERVPVVEEFSATGYDSHAELNWTHPTADLSYRIYASFDGGQTYKLRTETTDNYYLDFVPENGKNSTIHYRIASFYQGRESEPNERVAEIRDFSDDELLDMVQRYSFRYFWEGAHQATGMALERSNGNGRTVASGATGMGLMAMIVAHEREYQPKEEIKDRILKILYFLENCDRYHGAWSHWYNADTYYTQPFSEKDDGGDIVETSFVAQALIALRNYFAGTDQKSVQIRETADQLWREIDWDWYRNEQNVLYWHWSPNFNFEMNMKVKGWNEALITYLMAASSPTHGISNEIYEQGWAQNGNMVRKRTFYNYEINLSPDWGGPLFWIHYTHLGIDPRDLKDQYADYWQEHVNTARIHYAYAVQNPLNHENYGEKCWGLTASDDPDGYSAHQPMSNDNGTISPTAALASMPYTPEESMKALKYFYRERGQELFGKYGPYDAFNDDRDWVQEAYIGIDQGPIVVMIENYRTGLLWNTVRDDEEVKSGLEKLGFRYANSTAVDDRLSWEVCRIYPNPTARKVFVRLAGAIANQPVRMKLTAMDGRLLMAKNLGLSNSEFFFDCSGLPDGVYLIRLEVGKKYWTGRLVVAQ